MGGSPSNWSTYQLTEFLGFLTNFDEERATIAAAIERIAEAVEAEIGAVLGDEGVTAVVGCTPADLIPEDLLQLTASGKDRIELPNVGSARACGIALGDSPARRLVIARLAEDYFTADELNLISGMTRVLELVLKNIRTIEAERQARATLLHSQKMEAIGQLAGGIAHDFNNLLSIIINYTEFMREGLPRDHEILEDLKEVSDAAQRASHLTRQLLTMSRREMAEPEILDVNQLVRDVERLLRRVLPESIQLTIQVDDDLGRVLADPGHLEQVLMNLVLNARDAMPSGGELRISTANVDITRTTPGIHHELRPGPYIQLTVSDTGHGMDAATKDRIFEPFFTTKAKGEGTGLGLATVHGIVMQTGGSLTVQSAPGEGTTFHILLPTTDASSTGTSSDAERGQILGGRGETILVAEDEEGVRQLVGRILTSAGYEVLVASSGEEALDVFTAREEDIDLLLTDVVMPRMSGKALDEAARNRRPDLRTIFMSGYTDQIVAHSDLLPGGQAMLAKPFTSRHLLEKIESALQEPLASNVGSDAPR